MGVQRHEGSVPPACRFCQGDGLCALCRGSGRRRSRPRLLRRTVHAVCGACKGTGVCQLCHGGPGGGTSIPRQS